MSPELVPWLAGLCFLLGILGLVLEVFVMPGFGIAGITGLFLLGWGVFLLVVDVTQATQALVIALAATIVLFLAGVKGAARLKLWQRVSLESRQFKEAGYLASKPDLACYLGCTGVSVTPLRPSGTIEIDQTRLDVVSEGEYIPKEAKVEVINVEGSRVVVRRVKED